VYTRARMALFHENLVAIARPVSFAEGARLLRQGEPSRGAFVIRKGSVEARVALPGGGTLAVAQLGEGAMLGETALIERGVCSASVVACSAVEGWFVAREDFRAMVASRDPGALELQRGITRILAAKLHALNARLREHAAEEDRPARGADPAAAESAPGFDWRAFLRALPFFEGFDDEEVGELASLGRAFSLPRGARLFAAASAAERCFLMVRGAAEIYSTPGSLERRIAIAGPGELIGYLAVLERRPHGASARIREQACLLEFPAAGFLELYEGPSGTAVRLQHAIHRSLLRSLARTNTQLTRLISEAGLRGAHAKSRELETVLRSQIVTGTSD